ncbi:ferrochelatase [Reinekea marinisedimentorum]|uniref:Ferrochelatase n=1 Tax=Reinekea marinisedimentorum TaxID=230495 RepID=A0A4R3IE05_9GAMM|nr:ferrochelatase [Reinekea marinisedimentorum]TCS43987.1 ferrochelatase [Reinekea marinisedimentorum]
MNKPVNHPEVSTGKVGVLLVNLGTPDQLTVPSVRRYLRQFLSDSRVVTLPRLLWLPLLNLVILNVRPKKSLAAYSKIWRKEDNQSPLRYYTEQLTKGIAAAKSGAVVEFAMRYGEPAIDKKMAEMQKAGCDRILVVPLYPQYSATTNATVVDEVFRYLKKQVWQPSVRIAAPWYKHPAYIEALKAQVVQHIEEKQSQPDKILLSFHGLPEKSLEDGDPYYCQCMVTGRLLAEALGKTGDEVMVTFQSRFGPATWLQPYTAEVLESLPAKGVNNILVLTPGFVADCIETLEEIAIEGKGDFIAAGGKACDVLPCLNDSAEGLDVMNTVVTEELAGWLD